MAPKKVQTLKNSSFEFYKHHYEKGINYTHNELKNCELSKRTIYLLMAKFDKERNIDPEIRMIENLETKIHIANQNVLSRLLKF